MKRKVFQQFDEPVTDVKKGDKWYQIEENPKISLGRIIAIKKFDGIEWKPVENNKGKIKTYYGGTNPND